jgi:uncharacterized protein (DUF2141 family)
MMIFITNGFSKDIVIKIHNVTIQNGNIYIAIYSNEDDYKNEKRFLTFIKEPVNRTIVFTVDLPAGEYVIKVFQDVNNNGELDSNFFGIPKEPIGITNYNGRGKPGGFHKLKVLVNNHTNETTLNIGRIQ